VTRDRGRIEVDISQRWCEEWFDEDVVLQLVGATEDARALGESRVSVELAAAALERNFVAVVDRFGQPRWDSTRADLQTLRRLRAFQEFGVVLPCE